MNTLFRNAQTQTIMARFSKLTDSVMAHIFSMMTLREVVQTRCWAKSFHLSPSVEPLQRKVVLFERDSARMFANTTPAFEDAVFASMRYWCKRTEILTIWQTKQLDAVRRLFKNVRFPKLNQLELVTPQDVEWKLTPHTWLCLLEGSSNLVSIQLEYVDTSMMRNIQDWNPRNLATCRPWRCVQLRAAIPEHPIAHWHVFLNPQLEKLRLWYVAQRDVSVSRLKEVCARAPALLKLQLETNALALPMDDLLVYCLAAWPGLQWARFNHDGYLQRQETIVRLYQCWKWMQTFPSDSEGHEDVGISWSENLLDNGPATSIIPQLPVNQLKHIKVHPTDFYTWEQEDWLSLLDTSDKWETIRMECQWSSSQDNTDNVVTKILRHKGCLHLTELRLSSVPISASILEALCERKHPCPSVQLGRMSMTWGRGVDASITVDHLLACIYSPNVTSVSLNAVLTAFQSSPWQRLSDALRTCSSKKYIQFYAYATAFERLPCIEFFRADMDSAVHVRLTCCLDL
jgi:hypothetical protein